MVRYATVTTIMEFGVDQNSVKFCRYYGIIGKENHIFDAKNTENIQQRNWYVPDYW
jgi:hypothetical protein